MFNRTGFKGAFRRVTGVAISIASLSALTASNALAQEPAQAPSQTAPQMVPSTLTEENIAKLNVYAQSILKGRIQEEVNLRLSQLGTRPETVQPLEQMYSIRVREGGECFYESSIPVIGSTVGRIADRSITWEHQARAIQHQIHSTAEFLREIHINTRGQRIGPFNLSRIDICTMKQTGKPMILESDRLIIGIRRATTGYEVRNSMELRKLWDSGDALSDEKLKKFWLVLNPTGPVRTTLRKLLAHVAQSRAGDLQQSLQRASVSQSLPMFIKTGLQTEAVAESLCQDPSVWAASLSEPEARRLMEAWAKRISDSNVGESLIEASAAALQVAETSTNNKIRINQTGGAALNLGNYHGINVTAPISVGRYQRFVKIKESKLDIEVNQTKGLVNIFTIDDIHVNSGIHISLDKALESASFEEAVKDAGLRTQCGT